MAHGRRNRRNNGQPLLFIRSLQRTAGDHLPETIDKPFQTTPKGEVWRTQRLRPEVMMVVDALADRYLMATGHVLSTSEVIAAALLHALPVLAGDREAFPARPQRKHDRHHRREGSDPQEPREGHLPTEHRAPIQRRLAGSQEVPDGR